MSWAEDDFQSEKMDRSRHRESREGIASVPEAANTPPKEKIAPPAGGLRLERERERETRPARGGKTRFAGRRGGGVGVSGQKRIFTTFFVPKPFFVLKIWVPRGRAEPPPFLLAKLMKRLP